MTARVHLVRHGAHGDFGQVLSGRSDRAGLTALGRAQAGWAAAHLSRGEPVAAIHCSPRLRTRQTAAIIGDHLGVPVTVAAALDEIDFGDWTGCSFAALADEPEWHRWNKARATSRPPGGENMAAATGRAVAHLETLAAGGGRVLCVSHCDVIRGIVAHYLGLGFDRLLAFDVDPGSVSTLLIGDWGARLLKLNEGQE